MPQFAFVLRCTRGRSRPRPVGIGMSRKQRWLFLGLLNRWPRTGFIPLLRMSAPATRSLGEGGAPVSFPVPWWVARSLWKGTGPRGRPVARHTSSHSFVGLRGFGLPFPVLFSGCNTSLPLPALPPAPLTEALAGPRWRSPHSGVSEALRAPSSQPLPTCLRLSNSGTWPTPGCVAPSRLDDPLRPAAANAELPARHLPPSPARRGACRVLTERSEGGCGVAQVAKPATPGPAEEAQAGATTGVCADERRGRRRDCDVTGGHRCGCVGRMASASRSHRFPGPFFFNWQNQ